MLLVLLRRRLRVESSNYTQTHSFVIVFSYWYEEYDKYDRQSDRFTRINGPTRGKFESAPLQAPPRRGETFEAKNMTSRTTESWIENFVSFSGGRGLTRSELSFVIWQIWNRNYVLTWFALLICFLSPANAILRVFGPNLWRNWGTNPMLLVSYTNDLVWSNLKNQKQRLLQIWERNYTVE